MSESLIDFNMVRYLQACNLFLETPVFIRLHNPFYSSTCR